MRVIGICGRSFCGSTLLSRLFAAVPGVASAGEMHWLLDDPEVRGHCVTCPKGECPIFDDNRVRMAPREDSSLYSRVLKTYGPGYDVLVSSDKTVENYTRFVKPGTMDAIVLFKSPFGFAASDLRHQKRTVKQAMQTVKVWYEHYMAWAPSFARRVIYVDYDLLAVNHVHMMRAILAELDLPVVRVPERLGDIDYHHVLGNVGAHKHDEVFIDDRWKRELSEKQVDYIKATFDVMQLYREMQRRAVHLPISTAV